MTQKEYFEFLIKLAKLDDINENSNFSENLYGYFQCFMPYGKGIGKIFEPISNGEYYLNRIKKIYEITQDVVKSHYNQGIEPAYFTPSKSNISKETLIEIGNNLLKNLKTCATHFRNKEVLNALNKITCVQVVNYNIFKIESQTQFLVNDFLIDIYSDNDCDLMEILTEAYYSIACDYWLSYYLQQPKISSKIELDILEPYFILWKNGYGIKLCETEILISSTENRK